MSGPVLTDGAKKFLACLRIYLGLPQSDVPWDGAMHEALLKRECDAPGVAAMFGVSNDKVAGIRYGDFALTTPAVAVSAPLTDMTWPDAFWTCFGMPKPGGDSQNSEAEAAQALAQGDYSDAAKSAAEVIWYVETRMSKPQGSVIASLLLMLAGLGGAVWAGK